MDIFFERYADLILLRALGLKEGDVLSINTEECNSRFAHIIARRAKAITGNGSYIQLIEKGKVVETEEASTEFPIAKAPTALLHLPTFKTFSEPDMDKEYTAPELQEYRMLSEPMFNPTPSLPFCSAPVPNQQWGEILDEEGNEAFVASIISELLNLGEDDYLETIKSNEEILEYEKDKLNGLKLVKGRVYSEEGTDLSFSFMENTNFATMVSATSSNRKFVPTIYSSDIFRALDPASVNGYLNISKPIMLFGKRINNLSITFENGNIVDFSTDEYSASLFNLYLKQDKLASKATMLTIVEDSANASCIDYFSLPEWDRMRATSIVLGSPRPEGIDESVKEKCVDSLVSLYLPIGSDSLCFDALDENGVEYTIVEDGIIQEEE